MKIKISFLVVIILLFCNGCTNSITELKKSVFGDSFDGNVKLLKEDITVTKTDYMKYGPRHIKYQNYEIKVPYKIDGKVKKDIKNIPVRYILEMELGEAVGDMQIHSESDAMYKVMESEFTIEKGSQDGYITLKTDYESMAMQGEPDTYPYIWISIQLDDDDNTDDCLLIYNPYYQNNTATVRTKGDIWIVQDEIKIEKGEMIDDIQHYILSVPIKSYDTEDILNEKIFTGTDFCLGSETSVDDVSSLYMGSLSFMEGIKYGFVDVVMIEDSSDETTIKMDVYNRFADDIIGKDIVYYPFLWVAVDVQDKNLNNNYCIIKNPFFNEDNPPCPYEEIYKQLYYLQEPLSIDE